jgi:flagellar P-ring protein precursor FlgI
VNHPTVGRVPGGAIVERPAPALALKGVLHLQLRYADFTTASRIAAALNAKYGAAGALPARAENSALVSVLVPPSYAARPIDFIAEMEMLTVDADQPARVVVNERTGTIVMGRDVHISPVAILHGNLTVEIQTSLDILPPALPAGAAGNPLPRGPRQPWTPKRSLPATWCSSAAPRWRSWCVRWRPSARRRGT